MSYLADSLMVAGGAGFVGSAITRELISQGERVVCFDNYIHGVPENVQGLGEMLTLVQGDALDSWKLIDTINKYQVGYIIDCIGDTFVPSSYEMPQRFFDINLQANFNILMAAKVCGVKRVLYVSSTEVYGQHASAKFSEQTPLCPLNTYAVSKLAADRLCFTFHVEHKIPVVIARIFNCYGPRETHPYIIPEIISQLHKGPLLALGNIKARRDLTYVHDTAQALIAVLHSDIPNGEAVNVGSDTIYSVEWLVHQIAELMGVKGVEIRQDQRRFRHLDLDRLQCDNSKLKMYTGWSPRVCINEGLSETINWFKNNGCHWSWESSMRDTRLIEASGVQRPAPENPNHQPYSRPERLKV